MFKNIFHIYIKIMEITQNNNNINNYNKNINKKYLTTEEHHRAFYKFYNNHKQEIFKKLN